MAESPYRHVKQKQDAKSKRNGRKMMDEKVVIRYDPKTASLFGSIFLCGQVNSTFSLPTLICKIIDIFEIV
jgi:hypothetical protein